MSGDNNSKWVKHWVKGGYHYYHNLETQEGGWDEPSDFVQNSMQLSREEIQVGHISSQKKTLRDSTYSLEVILLRKNKGVWSVALRLKVRLQKRSCCAAQGTLLNVIWQPGWEGSLGENWIQVYIWLSPLAVHLKLSQHCESAMPQYKIKSLKRGRKKFF